MTAPLRKENARPSEPGTGDVTSDAVQGDIGHVTNGSYPRPLGATPVERVREMEGYDVRREFYTDWNVDALFDGEDAPPVWHLGDEDDGEPRDRVEVPL